MSQKQVRPGPKEKETKPPQEIKKKPSTAPPGGEDAAAATIAKGKKTKEDMDKILDEIDDILEENAEEFVRNYVQRGGE